MNKYICIHGHFYQPPRENAWLEKIEVQDSAYPYHDWNMRISSECYGPNARSRILDGDRCIIDIVNNYSKMSFNIGPTLFSWMEKNDPEVYAAILEADRLSIEMSPNRKGSAIAQCYNHMIMPLANTHNKETQVIWGIKDFVYRFKREPAGMWLPETAVDLETLDIMAANGIKFTVLAPHQAKREKGPGYKGWNEFAVDAIDTKRPYTCVLPSGRKMGIFFYDGGLSHEVAFGPLLASGETFAKRLLSAFTAGDHPQIVSIATDGETFGHHHKFGDMALAYCIYYLESNNLAKIVNFEDYLIMNPPSHEVEINPRTSWSCAHGVERWRSNCGCAIAPLSGWTQKWRAPLKEAMDYLNDRLREIFEKKLGEFTEDVWAARNGYIDIILNRSDYAMSKYMHAYFPEVHTKEDRTVILKLLEAERNAMLMYTSCGWFFDDVSGIETEQIMQYAARVIQLIKELVGSSLEKAYTDILEKAVSNDPKLGNGAFIYNTVITPGVIDLERVAVHYAIMSLFYDINDDLVLNTYSLKSRYREVKEYGQKKMAVGQLSVTSLATHEEKTVSYAMLHMGNYNIIGGAMEGVKKNIFDSMARNIRNDFNKGRIHDIITLIDRHFSGYNYSLRHLFRDEEREVLNKMFSDTLKGIENIFRQAYDEQYPVLQAAEILKIPMPKYYAMIFEFTLNADIKRIITGEKNDFSGLQRAVNELKKWSLDLDKPEIRFLATNKVNELIKMWAEGGQDLPLLEKILGLFRILKSISIELDLWRSQNMYFFVYKNGYENVKKKAEHGDRQAKTWLELFEELGCNLKVKIKK